MAAPFVREPCAALRAALVVKPLPEIAGVPPVYGEANAIADRAAEQFGVFVRRLAAHGVKVEAVDCSAATGNSSLSADAALVFADGAFLMRPSDLRRRHELVAIEAALQAAGLPILGRIEPPGLFDGGDALLGAATLYLARPRVRRDEIGIPIPSRGNDSGREQLTRYARTKGLRVVEVPLNADVRRLRSVAAFLDDETVLCAPGVVDAAAFAGLRVIDVPRGEDYGAGVLTLGPRTVLANLRFRETLPRLRRAKIAVDAIDLWEFGKVGASPGMLALSLQRT